MNAFKLLTFKIFVAFISLTVNLTMAKLDISFLQNPFEQRDFMASLAKLLKQVEAQHHFDLIITVNGLNVSKFFDSCLLFEDLKELQLPRLLLSTQELDSFKLTFQSTNVLIMSCHYLQYNNEFWYNKDFQLASHIILAHNNQEVFRICQSLMRTEVGKAAIILKDFRMTKIYYTCKLVFKSGRTISKVIKNALQDTLPIYREPYSNIQVAELSTHADQMLTRSFVFSNEMGHIRMDGYIGNIVETFASRIKASLIFKYPIQGGKVTFPEIIENLTLSGNLDLATSERLVRDNLDNLSYPIELIDYCYMMPLPHYVKTNKLFFIIVDLSALLIILSLILIYALLFTVAMNGSRKFLTFINIFLNDKSLRGLLGQSYTLPGNPSFSLNYICLLSGCSSMLFNTAYQAFLQSYLTEPPRENSIHSYDDLPQAGIRIIVTKRITEYLKPEVWEKYRNIFVVYDNYDDFVKQREKMNSNFAYSLTRPLWNVYQEKQKFFKQPLFYYSSPLCVMNFSLAAIPIRPGWPHRKLFDLHLMQLRDNGLMELWTSRTFFIMLRFGQTDFKDLSPSHGSQGKITNNDLFYIWTAYLICICVSIAAFVGELCYEFMKRRTCYKK